MNRKKNITLLYFFVIVQLSVGVIFNSNAQNPSGKLKISLIHTVNSHLLRLNDSVYRNDFNETYKITKLKYYLFNFKLNDIPLYSKEGKYLLVNAEKNENVIEFEKINNGSYSSLSFEVGVDSADNCSGAQTGALDPLNDMFWTWNSGYVFFKLEGTSPYSTGDLNRLEYHLGGYKGEDALITKINLTNIDELGNPASIPVAGKKETEVTIALNLDCFWKDGKVSIKQNPICVSPGKNAKKIAACFSSLFSIKSIINH